MKALYKTKDGVLLREINNKNLLPNCIRIKVKSVGLCRTDLLVANGTIPINNDIILGHEFSGIVINSNNHNLKVNDIVSVNPLDTLGFMGLDWDGCLREFIDIPEHLVIKSNFSPSFKNYKIMSYLEPVSASLAVLKSCNNKKIKGAVWGKNRIAELTYIILKNEGFNISWLDETIEYESSSYDYVIETLFDDINFQKIINILKPNGLLIVKSRKKQPVSIIPQDLVSKEINISSVNYYDFNKSMAWLEKNHSKIEHLLGESFYIDDWQKAFQKAYQAESKKIFIHF